MLETRLRRNLDWPLLALTYTLACLGVLLIFSVTRGDATAFYRKQIINIVLGSVALAGLSRLDYHYFVRFARSLYWINISLLLLVFMPGLNHAAKGAGRWIRIGSFPFQPSEFAKVFIILTLAIFLVDRHETIREPRTLALSLLHVAVPAALIFKQPDLGTAMVLVAIWFGMVFMAGARIMHLVAIVLAGALLFTVMWHTGKIKVYQKNRIVSFINPDADPKETGYHVRQARIAIGSGGMWGKGLLKSTQVRGGYVPEKETDFIFTDIGEEFGFAGALCITLLYTGLLLRGAQIVAASEEDTLGKLISTGIVTMFAVHIVVNISMNIGILPVVGVPLILISYGGSSMVLTLASVGILQSVSCFRHQLLF
jgi:rod shape determining protein RodA